MNWLKIHISGLALTFFIALVSVFLGNLFPIIGGAVFAILIGIIINNIFGRPLSAVPGIRFTSKKILQWAIVALGCGLNLSEIFKTGSDSLYILVFTLSAAFLTAHIFGKLLKIDSNLKSLIGVGTAICGGSAIASISPIIEASDTEVAYSISTIFLFNVIAIFIFPILGHLLNFSDKAFGLLAGTAINDTSSVVAAGYAFSNAAGSYATIVKLTRTTMIIPVSIVFTIIMSLKKKRTAIKNNNSVNYNFKSIFPWFILWFIGFSVLNTLGVFNKSIINFTNILAKFLIVMALSAVGLSSNFKEMTKSGVKPIFLGLIVWFTVTVVSIAVQILNGQV
ncbi:YeiH family putative sulfate export transporter [Clostridium sp. cel8]|jgi:uncharacterized integral membrane protein (TIGR00698 family)|uniref:YeiH family protein n=1 Tax=Clostridium sp. cel8 TaxID=2663123 RepID=UPI0015F3EBC7|nr:YeiH family protein [Clostridium sp. cel8]MBA5850169.1 YeiH family putative sulfate export transporter [Clostridium sp. cel8]